MTAQDLLRHSSGLPSRAASLLELIKRRYAEARVGDRGVNSDQWSERLAKMLLLFQAGSTWKYDASVDVLGVIVKRVSSVLLRRLFAERIIGTLKMLDTGFAAPASHAHRAALGQREGPKNVVPNIVPIATVQTVKSGSGGMVSTAHDYAGSCQCLLNRGELDGVRLVSPKAIDLTPAIHLPVGTPIGPDMTRFEALVPSAQIGQVFGLGFGCAPMRAAIRCPDRRAIITGAARRGNTSGSTPRRSFIWDS